MRKILAVALVIVLVPFAARAGAVVDQGSGSPGGLPWRVNQSPPGIPFSCFVDSATSTTQCQAAPGAGLNFYNSDLIVSNGGTAQSVALVQGTGTNCSVGASNVSPSIFLPVNGSVAMQLRTVLKGSAANAQLCCKPSGSTAFSCLISGYIAP